MSSGCRSPGTYGHVPVMVRQVLEWILPSPEGLYIDATLGSGGHSLALLRAGAGRILALDRDQSALEMASRHIEQAGFSEQAFLVHARYEDLARIMAQDGWDRAQGLILDAGVSSLQLDDPARGFSFAYDGPLDMRMDPSRGADAAELVNRASEYELKRIIREYGQEPMAGRIARRIVEQREAGRIVSTGQLAEVVSRAYPGKRRARSRNHPATKTFQALRIAVNRELEGLKSVLAELAHILVPGARAVIISFHSLEDRMVKHEFRRQAKGCLCPPDQQVCSCEPRPGIQVLTKKPLLPEPEEIRANPRSRSAKMRVAEVL